jgi:hypothetical protein
MLTASEHSKYLLVASSLCAFRQLLGAQEQHGRGEGRLGLLRMKHGGLYHCKVRLAPAIA